MKNIKKYILKTITYTLFLNFTGVLVLANVDDTGSGKPCKFDFILNLERALPIESALRQQAVAEDLEARDQSSATGLPLGQNALAINVINARNLADPAVIDRLSLIGIEAAKVSSIIRAGEFLVLTDMGPSLWEHESFNAWMGLRPTGMLTEMSTAHEQVEYIGVVPEHAHPGLSPELVAMMSESFNVNMNVFLEQGASSINKDAEDEVFEYLFGSVVRRTSRQVIESERRNTVRFPWGAGIEFAEHNGMDPELALGVVATLARFSLVDNLIFQNQSGDMVRVKDALDFDSRIFLARVPSMSILGPVLSELPIILNPYHIVAGHLESFELPIHTQNIMGQEVFFKPQVKKQKTELDFTPELFWRADVDRNIYDDVAEPIRDKISSDVSELFKDFVEQHFSGLLHRPQISFELRERDPSMVEVYAHIEGLTEGEKALFAYYITSVKN